MSSLDDENKQDTLDRVYELAFAYERDIGCCPQCVLAAIQDELGVVTDDTIKASHGLSGGSCLSTRGTCGALAGAILALGAKHGRERSEFERSTGRQGLSVTKRAYDAFVAVYGSPICGEIQTRLMGRSFDLWDMADYQAFLAAGGHTDKCTVVAGTAARIAAEILLER